VDREADQPTAAVLDLGCAAGVPVAADLAERYQVTGVDISPEHIQQAAANVPAAEFICGDARTVSLPPGHFDAIISLMYFSMFGAEATRQLVSEAGFGIEETALGTQTEGPTDISYTWILARKQPSAG
jgi:SAM-dependent methyltransferase